jgi:hypothetical protein
MLTGVILNKVSINSMKTEEIPEKSKQIAAKIKTITNKNSLAVFTVRAVQ